MSVYQKDKTGKWYYNFMLDGKRYHRSCKGATNYREALQCENIVKAEIMRGNYGIAEKKCHLKLSEMIKKYLEYSETNKSSFTHDKTYSRYWLEYFGDKIISQIKPIDIEGYKKYRVDIVKPSTVNRELNSLSKMLSIAVKNGYIENNPCSGVKKLKIDNHKIRFLTLNEEKRLFESIEKHWIKPIVICALQTGMRKSEILDLKWDCVNFTQKYIDILKTKSGKARQIPMSDKLHNALQEQPRINEYVFVNPITKNRHSNINDIFPDFLKKSKIKSFRFHDLRHTAATRMVEKGADLVVVKDILGHADITTTMRYAHPVPEMKLKAIKSLNDY